MSYIEGILFTICIALVKLSILAIYWTVFGVSLKQKTVIITATGFTVAWFISFLFIVIFQCIPVGCQWSESGLSAECIFAPLVLLTFEVTNLLNDVLILAIPAFFIGRLQLNTAKKYSAIGIFLLGAGYVHFLLGNAIEI